MSRNFKPPRLEDLDGLTVPALLELRAAQMPFRIALSAQSVTGFRDRIGYAQLALSMRKVEAGLVDIGVRPGDRVAIYLGNDAGREAVLTALGCLAIGAIVVPLSTRSSDEELRYGLELTRPVQVITTAAAVERIRGVFAGAVVLLDAPCESAAPEHDVSCWPEPTRSMACDKSHMELSPEMPAVLLFTSGTTARSKAVVHTHRSMLHAGLSMGEALGLSAGDLYQGAFPFFTSSCLNLACMSSWVHGAGFVMEQVLDNAQRLHLIESECTTFYHGVPSILRFMLAEAQQSRYNLQRVRCVAYGGASMPSDTIQRIADQWPWMEQVHVWGMTESGPAGAYLEPRWLPAKAGSIGHAMPHCELRVVDDYDATVDRGTHGQLCFRGLSMAVGYYQDSVATAQTFRGGWLYTGDVVVQDEDGFLHFVDRLKDVINRGGLKISSAAVETVLHRFPGVVEAAVVAVPHAALGEDVAACVVVEQGYNLDFKKLEAWCVEHLADYAVPKRWLSLDALPKSPIGKVLKRDLRDILAARDVSRPSSQTINISTGGNNVRIQVPDHRI